MVKQWVTVQSWNLGIQATEKANTIHAKPKWSLPSRGKQRGGSGQSTTHRERKDTHARAYMASLLVSGLDAGKMYVLAFPMTYFLCESHHSLQFPFEDAWFKCDSKSDLFAHSLSDKRVWLRIRDPNSSKRKLPTSSPRIISMHVTWFK